MGRPSGLIPNGTEMAGEPVIPKAGVSPGRVHGRDRLAVHIQADGVVGRGRDRSRGQQQQVMGGKVLHQVPPEAVRNRPRPPRIRQWRAGATPAAVAPEGANRSFLPATTGSK